MEQERPSSRTPFTAVEKRPIYIMTDHDEIYPKDATWGVASTAKFRENRIRKMLSMFSVLLRYTSIVLSPLNCGRYHECAENCITCSVMYFILFALRQTWIWRLIKKTTENHTQGSKTKEIRSITRPIIEAVVPIAYSTRKETFRLTTLSNPKNLVVICIDWDIYCSSHVKNISR